MSIDPELVRIIEQLGTQEWSPRKVTCGFYIDEGRDLVVLGTSPLLPEEREALWRIGGDRILLDESADPDDPSNGRRS